MQKNNYSYEDLISCGKGELFGEGNAKLPLPPMLMFDRITKIDNKTNRVSASIKALPEDPYQNINDKAFNCNALVLEHFFKNQVKC